MGQTDRRMDGRARTVMWPIAVGGVDANRSSDRRHSEEDKRACSGTKSRTSTSQDAADGAAGMHWHHRQPGQHS